MKALLQEKGEFNNILLFLLLGIPFCYATIMLGSSKQPMIDLILAYGISAFTIYGVITWKQMPWAYLFVMGLVGRFGLLFVFPGLSDDIYRFIWDGRLTVAGYNPYSCLPYELTLLEYSIPGMDQELYRELNSTHYYTIYPPVSQFIFWLSTVCKYDVGLSSLIIKVIFLMAEVATFVGISKLLNHLNKPAYLAGIYWLNPLIIAEGLGNVHFEIIMIVFLVWAIYFLFVKPQLSKAAILLSLSVAAKLLPLIFLPYLFFRMERKQVIKFFTTFTLSCLVIFLPIFLELQFTKFGASIDLYFQKFEFNASVYYVLRYVGKLLSGYNLIHYLGPLLGLTTLILILRKARSTKLVDLQSFIDFSLFAFCTYLLLATTVHPWYLAVPVLLSIFSTYRFAVVWSALAMLTYVNYSGEMYKENLTVVALEYIVVIGYFLYEYYKKHIGSLKLRHL